MYLNHKQTRRFSLLHLLYFLTLQSSLEFVMWLQVAPQTMKLSTQDCNRTGSGLRAGDSQNNTKYSAVCKYRICEHKENRTGHGFRRDFGKQGAPGIMFTMFIRAPGSVSLHCLKCQRWCHLYLLHLEEVFDGRNVAGTFCSSAVLHIRANLWTNTGCAHLHSDHTSL